jgi:uroporphyrinogen decarboxylase
MNGKERLETALSLGVPDAVPVWELGYNESSIRGIASFFMDEADLPSDKILADMDGEDKVKTIGALASFVRELDIDGVTAFNMMPRERVDKNHIKDAMGVVSHLSPLGEPHPVSGPINDPSDLDSFKMRRPEESDLLMLDALKSSLPDRSVAFDTQGPFRLGWGVMASMEKMLMAYLLEPEFVHRLSRVITDYCLELLEMAIQKGADWILLDGDLAFNAGPLMSPDHYKEFILPYHREICELVHQKGKKIAKHSDGNIGPIIPDLIEAGFDGIHPIQPQNMDIGQTKEKYGDQLCLLGNIDCSHLLVTGTESEVEETVRQTIEVASPKGGYIISSSNSIHPEVNPQNYIAMVKAAKKYGRY